MPNPTQVKRWSLVSLALAAVLWGPLAAQAAAADALADSLAELVRPDVIEPSDDPGSAFEARVGPDSVEESTSGAPATLDFPADRFPRPSRVESMIRPVHDAPPHPPPLSRRLAMIPALLL